jgi:hypothetical protein
VARSARPRPRGARARERRCAGTQLRTGRTGSDAALSMKKNAEPDSIRVPTPECRAMRCQRRSMHGGHVPPTAKDHRQALRPNLERSDMTCSRLNSEGAEPSSRRLRATEVKFGTLRGRYEGQDFLRPSNCQDLWIGHFTQWLGGPESGVRQSCSSGMAALVSPFWFRWSRWLSSTRRVATRSVAREHFLARRAGRPDADLGVG